jgi:sterol desaturase/sphingolipid hydroxylase (fatty acid hydroxylase superfamily)
MKFALISLAVLMSMNVIAFGYSWMVLKLQFRKSQAIQPKDYKPDVLPRRIPLILLNIVLIWLFAFTSFYIFQDFFILDGFPSVWVFLIQFLLFFLIDDAWFYLMHRSFHEFPFLMQRIHKRHHTASKPFPLDYMYVNPLEWMLGMIGPALGVVTIMLIFGQMYAWPMWIMIVFRSLHEIQAHSGLRATWTRYSFFLGTSDHHDHHHSMLNGNYGSITRIWDLVFGTEIVLKKQGKSKSQA